MTDGSPPHSDLETSTAESKDDMLGLHLRPHNVLARIMHTLREYLQIVHWVCPICQAWLDLEFPGLTASSCDAPKCRGLFQVKLKTRMDSMRVFHELERARNGAVALILLASLSAW